MRQRPAAAPYAKALFALAKERNQTELVGRELDAVAATFESDLDLGDLFARVDSGDGEADGGRGGAREWLKAG